MWRTLLTSYKFTLQKNVLFYSILLFLSVFICIHLIKPPLLYDKRKRFRMFGIGARNKTVISIWIVAILLGILSYMIIVYLSKN